MAELEERPPGYVGPDLDPSGVTFQARWLARNVIALLARPMPRDNNGVIIGSRGVLVVDAGINGNVAKKLQEIVHKLTDRPILYVVNTTYHGDHSFGNAAFPPSVRIVSSAINRDCMVDLDREKRMRRGNLRGNPGALDDVVVWRKPDLIFDDFMELDLGDTVVQLWHFGPGNGPGDTIVYAPSARTAWTGNFVGRRGVAPMLLEGGPRPYIESLRRMKATLKLSALVPGHGPMARGTPDLAWMIQYLRELDGWVRAGVAAGKDLAQLLDERRSPEVAPLAPLTHLLSRRLAALDELNRNMDRLNVVSTYRGLGRASRSSVH
jgi:cyclase